MPERPTAPELIDAVRGFLEQEIAPDLSGRRRFHMRVVVNVLGILEREWTHGEEAARAHYDRLVTLLGVDEDPPVGLNALLERIGVLDGRLAAAVRAGELDDRFDDVLDAVYATTIDTLRISNPGWLEEPD